MYKLCFLVFLMWCRGDLFFCCMTLFTVPFKVLPHLERLHILLCYCRLLTLYFNGVSCDRANWNVMLKASVQVNRFAASKRFLIQDRSVISFQLPCLLKNVIPQHDPATTVFHHVSIIHNVLHAGLSSWQIRTTLVLLCFIKSNKYTEIYGRNLAKCEKVQGIWVLLRGTFCHRMQSANQGKFDPKCWHFGNNPVSMMYAKLKIYLESKLNPFLPPTCDFN